MGRKRLSGVSKTYHIRVTSSTEKDLYDFIEKQQEQGKSFKDIFVLLFNHYNKREQSGSIVDLEAVSNKVLTVIKESSQCHLEDRFDDNFVVVDGVIR